MKMVIVKIGGIVVDKDCYSLAKIREIEKAGFTVESVKQALSIWFENLIVWKEKNKKGLTKAKAYDTIQVQTKDRKRQRLTTRLTDYLIGGRLTEEPKPSTWI